MPDFRNTAPGDRIAVRLAPLRTDRIVEWGFLPCGCFCLTGMAINNVAGYVAVMMARQRVEAL